MSDKTLRSIGACISAAALGLTCWAVVVACSSGDARTGFTPEDASEAATPPSGFDGATPLEDAGVCPPSAPKKPLLAAPTARFEAACSTTQVDGYLKDCLQSDGNVCTAYKTANTACVKCIESSSADVAWGPIVFYGAREFYDYNYGGCIANVTGDFSETGCGASQTRYLECRHAACIECLPPGLPRDFAPFYECQTKMATDKLCAEELNAMRGACSGYFATKPVDACQGSTLPTNDYLRQLISGWCGGSGSDAGDGG